MVGLSSKEPIGECGGRERDIKRNRGREREGEDERERKRERES